MALSDVLLCVDPGLRGCGVAVFHGPVLLSAAYVKNPEKGDGYAAHAALGREVGHTIRGNAFSQVLIEHPRIYPGAPDKDLNDLLDVVAVGAAIAANEHVMACCFDRKAPLLTVYPSEWKGNVKKSVMTERIRSALTPDELKLCRFTNKSDDSDLLDAVGIGLWRLGRLNKKVYPGASK